MSGERFSVGRSEVESQMVDRRGRSNLTVVLSGRGLRRHLPEDHRKGQRCFASTADALRGLDHQASAADGVEPAARTAVHERVQSPVA